MSRKLDDLRKRNIDINSARADKEYAKNSRITEAPERVKRYHRKMFENAEIERERRE